MQKRIILLLCELLAALLCFFTACNDIEDPNKGDEGITDNGEAGDSSFGESSSSSSAYKRNGSKITFGEYPQMRVTDETLAATLNGIAGTLPTEENSQNWTSYGYYIEGKVKDYMWYIDVKSGEDRYRGVYFTSYRPYYCGNSGSADNSFQSHNG